VKPQRLATFTISSTFPAQSPRLRAPPWASRTVTELTEIAMGAGINKWIPDP
jgi:hypothetical protein